jgi:hypothetical protein
MIDLIEKIQERWNKAKRSSTMAAACLRAENYFNIVERDGRSVITFKNVIVSTEQDGDGDLIARLFELRKRYVEEPDKDKYYD